MKTIVVTGAKGFIGSCLVKKLNLEGYTDIILVDDFSEDSKDNNLRDKKYFDKISIDDFFAWFEKNNENVDFVFHIGAISDTTVTDQKLFDRFNLDYSKEVWNRCTEFNVPLVYASSAATYGDGSLKYEDDHDIVDDLEPLNLYGKSKNDFDKWALAQEKQPYFWAGLKFFNVYGPNEFHKGRMASVIFHAFNQIKETGAMKLFASHNPDYKDGEQLRDFVYVKDVVEVCHFLLTNKPAGGIYNVGTGKARTFLDLTKAVFSALEIDPEIGFIDTPIDIRDKYQYFTEAPMNKLRSIGYDQPFHSLEDGVADYVKNYLIDGKFY